MLLEEYDSGRAVIEPADLIGPIPDIPKVAVSCFSRVTFARMLEGLPAHQIGVCKCANLETPVYRAEIDGADYILVDMEVGAPCCTGMLEELYAMGVQTVVLFGNCGVLDRSIEDCSIIVPTAALRDEGTSYHYLPSSDEIEVNREYGALLCGLLDELDLHYTRGKTWTTDAFYRETPEKLRRRREQGCVCVEMECSAAFAVAEYRKKGLCMFFYAGDNLDAEQWDKRRLSAHSMVEEKDRIAQIAIALAARIRKGIV